MKGYFSPEHDEFNLKQLELLRNELIALQEVTSPHNQEENGYLGSVGDLAIMYSPTDVALIQEKTKFSGIYGFKKIIDKFKFRYRRFFSNYIGANWKL